MNLGEVDRVPERVVVVDHYLDNLSARPLDVLFVTADKVTPPNSSAIDFRAFAIFSGSPASKASMNSRLRGCTGTPETTGTQVASKQSEVDTRRFWLRHTQPFLRIAPPPSAWSPFGGITARADVHVAHRGR